jgi:hypothetical protein
MPDHDFDERIARLQRTAYGADVSDEQREAAATELAALRATREQRVGRRGSAAGGSPGTADAGSEETSTAATSDSPTDEAPHAGATAFGSSTRAGQESAQTSLVRAAAIALLAGLAGLTAGWALGAVASRGDRAGTVPASETEAWRVFDLPTPNGDRVRYPAPPVDLELDRDSRRVLAARGDGVRVIAVRSVDGRDACLVLISPVDAPAAACTVDGRFPAEGLVAQTEDPSAGLYSATWDATGRISLAPPVPGD